MKNFDLSSLLAKIQNKNEDDINKSPSERREDKLKELNNKLLEARSNYEAAPLNLESAEKKYYTLKDGANSYETRQLNKYKKEAENLKTEMLNKHEEDMKKSFVSLSYYNYQQTYTSNSNAVKLALLKDVKNKLQELKNEHADKNTNNRKTYYLLQEQESIDFWLQLLNTCIIAFMIVFIVYSIKENHITTFTYIFLIGCIFIIYGLEWVIKLIQSIPLSFNIYTSWGEDTDHPQYTFFSIVIIAAILLFIIYKKNAVIDSYFK